MNISGDNFHRHFVRFSFHFAADEIEVERCYFLHPTSINSYLHKVEMHESNGQDLKLKFLL